MFAGMIDKECLPVGKNPLVGISLPVEVMGILAGAGNTQQFIINNVNPTCRRSAMTLTY